MPLDSRATPAALYGHCVMTYNTMLSEASAVVIEDKTLIVWEGMLTRLITSDLNLSVPYYTTITKALRRMGCVRQIKRGGGTAPSRWELIQEPTEELFDSAIPKREIKQNKYELLQTQIDSLNNRVGVLERALRNVIEEETGG